MGSRSGLWSSMPARYAVGWPRSGASELGVGADGHRPTDRVVVLAEGEVVSAGPARRVVAESPAFAPQVAKVLGGGWMTMAELAPVLERA